MANHGNWSLQETCDLIIARHLGMTYFDAAFFVRRSRRACEARWNQLGLPRLRWLGRDDSHLLKMIEAGLTRQQIHKRTGIRMNALSGRIFRARKNAAKVS